MICRCNIHKANVLPPPHVAHRLSRKRNATGQMRMGDGRLAGWRAAQSESPTFPRIRLRPDPGLGRRTGRQAVSGGEREMSKHLRSDVQPGPPRRRGHLRRRADREIQSGTWTRWAPKGTVVASDVDGRGRRYCGPAVVVGLWPTTSATQRWRWTSPGQICQNSGLVVGDSRRSAP